jgi:hypothetical protein
LKKIPLHNWRAFRTTFTKPERLYNSPKTFSTLARPAAAVERFRADSRLTKEGTHASLNASSAILQTRKTPVPLVQLPCINKPEIDSEQIIDTSHSEPSARSPSPRRTVPCLARLPEDRLQAHKTSTSPEETVHTLRAFQLSKPVDHGVRAIDTTK